MAGMSSHLFGEVPAVLAMALRARSDNPSLPRHLHDIPAAVDVEYEVISAKRQIPVDIAASECGTGGISDGTRNLTEVLRQKRGSDERE